MTSYREVFAIGAERAVAQSTIDLESFVALGAASGMSDEQIISALLDDLDADGPNFGKFKREMAGAATGSVMAAQRQGETVAAVVEDPQLERLLRLRGVDGSVVDAAMNGANPEAAQLIEDAVADNLEEVWVAELRKTCHLCLPLHGTSLTREEWREAGLLPDTIHTSRGWARPCYCRLVPRKLAEKREDLLAPLVRVPQEKGSKRTVRGVSQEDVTRAMRARDKALESEEGRRVLRRLGKANAKKETPQ